MLWIETIYLTNESVGLQKLIVYIPCIHSDLCLIEEIRGHSPVDTIAQLALCKRMSLINFRIVSNEKQREERLLVNIKLLTVGWSHFALGERQNWVSLAQSMYWLNTSNDTRKNVSNAHLYHRNWWLNPMATWTKSINADLSTQTSKRVSQLRLLSLRY